MSRSSVDLPQPERPRKPTISPGRSVRLTSSSTTSASPSALRKDLLTPRTSRSGARFRAAAVAFTGVSSDVALSGDAELPLGARVQGAPEHAIQRHDEQAQHDRAEDAALEVSLNRGFRDVGAESVRGELLLTPAYDLGHDAGVPRAARGGDCPGDEERKHGRQRHPPPPQPAAHAKVLGRIAQVRGQGRCADDDVRSEEHTSELQSRGHLVCRLLLEKKKKNKKHTTTRQSYHSAH